MWGYTCGAATGATLRRVKSSGRRRLVSRGGYGSLCFHGNQRDYHSDQQSVVRQRKHGAHVAHDRGSSGRRPRSGGKYVASPDHSSAQANVTWPIANTRRPRAPRQLRGSGYSPLALRWRRDQGTRRLHGQPCGRAPIYWSPARTPLSRFQWAYWNAGGHDRTREPVALARLIRPSARLPQ